ncbi:lipoate--protein ligase family protein, partial [Klebsiella pneumoniae]|uniref:lipoate--protein ligase family protein n=1 Tax=Klebsiella pneumoniae TaxID=573 RepID=UPI0025A300CA
RRRLSGGGAVYHDLGNLCYTLIADAPESGEINFSPFCKPVIEAIRTFGVEAELSGRNDIIVAGRKISGNAQYYHNGKVIHHGTILFSSNIAIL